MPYDPYTAANQNTGNLQGAAQPQQAQPQQAQPQQAGTVPISYNFKPGPIATGADVGFEGTQDHGNGSGIGQQNKTTNVYAPNIPVTGVYGANFQQQNNDVQSHIGVQRDNQKWSQIYDPNYQDYTALSTIGQQYGAQAQQPLNDPRVQGAIAKQQELAQGPSSSQLNALTALGASAQGNSQAMSLLGNAAAGNGPTAAGVQQQAGISAAMRAQLTAGASARGGAYAQAAAQEQAAGQAQQTQLAGVGQAAQLRAQEQQSAQAQFAQAQNQAQAEYAGAANQQSAGQTLAASQAEAAAAGQQTAAMQYYEGQQNAYNQQGQFAGNLAQSEIANDYGLSGTQLQTQTQQNIANQQQNTQIAGAGIAAAGGLLAAALASTGASAAAAKGARDSGADPHTAARIGAMVGQHVGDTRGIRTPGTEAADTKAAKGEAVKRMTREEGHAHLAMLRKGTAPIPRQSAYEPAAPAAYAAGSHLAALAAMHGRR